MPTSTVENYLKAILRLERSADGPVAIGRIATELEVTPGTVTEENLLEERKDNLLMAISSATDNIGIAVLDITSGRFSVQELPDYEHLLTELERLKPAELLISEDDSLFSPFQARKFSRETP